MNYPFHVLNDKEQIEVLYKFFQMKEPNLDKLEKNISKLLLPAGGILQSGLTYDQFIQKIATRRKIDIPVTSSLSEKEKFLFEKIAMQNLEAMPEEERQELQEKLIQEAHKKGLSKGEIASVTSIATIGAAQLSGFGVYLLASSTIGAITSLVGVTLPFAFYTGMSSVISFAIGPVGLLIAAIPLYKTFKDVRSWDEVLEKGKEMYDGFKILAKGNYELAEVILSYFASFRILKIEEYETRHNERLQDLKNKEIEVDIEERFLEVENHTTREIYNKIEEVKQSLKNLESQLEEQKEVNRLAYEKITSIKREKLKINDDINRILKIKESLSK